MVVTLDKACSSALDGFQLVDVGIGVWIPGGACVLKDGPDKGLITLCLDFLWAACQVSPEEGETVVCLLCSGCDMGVHGELLVDVDAQVFSTLHHLKLTVVDGVSCPDGVSFPGYANNLTL